MKYNLIASILFLLAPINIFAQVNATQTGTVIKVEDGDTLLVYTKSHKEHVRLIGIDTPESYENPKALRDAERNHKDLQDILQAGQKATEFVRTIVRRDDKIMLEFDVEERDKYGRLLAYVYLPSQKMLNEEIISSGYAYQLTIPPNVKYQETFKNAYSSARAEKRGLWK